MSDTTLTAAPICPHCSARDNDACSPAATAMRHATSGEVWVRVTCSACRRQYEVASYFVVHYSTRIDRKADSGRSGARASAGAGKMPRQQEKP